jgi:predicted transcriptional regulator
MHRMKDVTTPTFGPTECEILGILWEQGPLTVRQVHDVIRKRRKIAYTTILTTSERMEDKGLIVRTAADWKHNSALTLTPALSRAELVTRAAAKICTDLGANADVLAALERSAS